MKLRQGLFAVAVAAILVPAAHGGQFEVLHTFGASGDGSHPYGPLLPNKQGKLFGVTSSGGTSGCGGYGCGTVFELVRRAKGGWAEHAVHDFTNGSDGANPEGNLVADTAGNPFGTLSGAGPGETAV